MGNRQMNTMGRQTTEHYGQTDRWTLWADRQMNTMGRQIDEHYGQTDS